MTKPPENGTAPESLTHDVVPRGEQKTRITEKDLPSENKLIESGTVGVEYAFSR